MTVSSRDGQPALAALAEAAARLAGSTEAFIYRKDGDHVRLVASHGQAATEGPSGETDPLLRSTIQGRAILDGGTVRAGDLVAAPMLRNGATVGAIVVRRGNSRSFSSAQAHRLEAFAAHAAVVIQELEERDRELADTRAQYAATAEIVRAISSSTDMRRVFDMLAENAVKLCHGQFGGVFQFDGDLVHLLAQHGLTADGADVYARSFPRPPGRDSAIGRALLDRAVVHIPDLQQDAEYGLTALAMAGTIRCVVAVPVLREGHPIGGIVAWRSEPEPFADRHIELLKTFADQTLIAIENARLVSDLEARNRELTETLEQQTATAEILRAISGSPTDIQPVLDTVVRAAVRFCGATDVVHLAARWPTLRGAAGRGTVPGGDRASGRREPGGSRGPGDAGLGDRPGRPRSSHGARPRPGAEPEDEFPEGRDLQRRFGHRTVAATPLLREGTPIGAIALFRTTVDPFSDKQLELLRTFADQAVIAIENVRLFTELQARNRELTEALEQQTATGEILRAISSSPTDIQPSSTRWSVRRALLRGDGRRDLSARGSDAPRGGGSGAVRRGDREPDGRQLGGSPVPVARGSVTGRAVLERRPVHIHDVAAEPEDEFPEGRDLQRRFGYGTVVATPLLREGTPLGAIALFRSVVDPFSDRQLELLRTFADQAVIAIENVRLFTELQARNRELTESLEQQTATSEILRIISTSPTDLQPVLQTVAANAARLCAADDGHIWQRDGAEVHLAASWGGRPTARRQLTISRQSVVGRAVLDRVPIHVLDLAEAYPTEFPDSQGMKELGYRTILAVPLLREGAAIGAVLIRRTEVRPFTDKQIELLKTFADQAVIAIENVRLFQELEARNRDLTETLEQQTATGEILRVISSSPTDVQPVFDTIAQNARRLCDAEFCAVFRFDGRLLHFVAHDGAHPPRASRPGVAPSRWRRTEGAAPGGRF